MAVDELAELAQHQSLTLRSASSCKNKRKPDLKSNFGSKIATQLKNHFANILPKKIFSPNWNGHWNGHICMKTGQRENKDDDMTDLTYYTKPTIQLKITSKVVISLSY